MQTNTNYLRITKDTIIPSLIGIIAGGYVGSIQYGTLPAIIFFGSFGALLGILAEHTVSMRTDTSEDTSFDEKEIEEEIEEEDKKEYVCIPPSQTLAKSLADELEEEAHLTDYIDALELGPSSVKMRKD